MNYDNKGNLFFTDQSNKPLYVKTNDDELINYKNYQLIIMLFTSMLTLPTGLVPMFLLSTMCKYESDHIFFLAIFRTMKIAINQSFHTRCVCLNKLHYLVLLLLSSQQCDRFHWWFNAVMGAWGMCLYVTKVFVSSL